MPGISVSKIPIPFRGAGGLSWQTYWTTQYQSVLDAMETEPSNYDKLRQARLMKRLVDEGYYDKAELLDFFCTQSGGQLLNWKTPGTFDPSLNNTPQFEPYLGYRGRITTGPEYHNVKLNFTPSSDATLTTQNNECMIIGVGDDRIDTQDDCGSSGVAGFAKTALRAAHNDGKAYLRSQEATGTIANINTIKYYAVSRDAANHFDAYINKAKTVVNGNSTGIVDKEIFAAGNNTNGTFYACRRIIRFVCRFSFLTTSEIERFIDIMEEYLKDYKANLIDYDTNYYKPYPATKSILPLTTYDGSGVTIHPSVVDCGVDWNGYRYWQANTPYPSSNSDYENPSVWASNDGNTWVLPDGLTNPIISKPDGVGAFNADPDILFEDNKLYIIWNEFSGALKGIKITSSEDGVTWAAPKVIYTCVAPCVQATSCSIIKIGGRYFIYYSDGQDGHKIKRVSCDTIDGTYGDVEIINMPTESVTGSHWYHFDVYAYNSKYYFVATASDPLGVFTRVYILISSDGVGWTLPPFAAMNLSYDTVALGITSYYRPCLSTIGAQVVVYCSVITTVGQLMIMNIDLI